MALVTSAMLVAVLERRTSLFYVPPLWQEHNMIALRLVLMTLLVGFGTFYPEQTVMSPVAYVVLWLATLWWIFDGFSRQKSE